VDRKVLSRLIDPGRSGKKRSSPAWTARQLGPAEQEYLAALPERLELEQGGVSILVVHGSPLDLADLIYPSITDRALRAKLGPERPGLLVCGHTHLPFARRIDGIQVVNCGSVGRPIDGDPRGALSLVDLADGRVTRARIVRFEFPLEPLLQDLERRGAPGSAFDHLMGPRSPKGR